jgi:hypothetical protein
MAHMEKPLTKSEETVFSQKDILLSPSLSTGSLIITERKDGTKTLTWIEDWDTEIFKDTFTLSPGKPLDHTHYFEDDHNADTVDMTKDDTRRTLQIITQYLEHEKDAVAVGILSLFEQHIDDII